MLKILTMVGLVLMVSTSASNKMSGASDNFQSVMPQQSILLQSGPEKESCSRCGMNLIMFYKTNHAAKLNGHQYQYCSLHCLTEHENSGAKLSEKKVVDVLTLKFIDINDAQYVVGSDIDGTMSRVSKYVFRHEKNAKIFQSKFGGIIMDYNDAKKVSQQDF